MMNTKEIEQLNDYCLLHEHPDIVSDDARILEWWHKNKKLTIYFDQNKVEYYCLNNSQSSLSVFGFLGADRDGVISNIKELLDIFAWLRDDTLL